MKTLQQRAEELVSLTNMIQSELFQEYIARPMKAERDKLRTAFFSDTLKDAWRKGGKQEGIELFMKLIENIHIERKDVLREIETSEREQ